MIIGIITRKSLSGEGHNINVIYDDISKAVLKNGGLSIGITLDKNYKNLIKLCDGIIFQGGDLEEKYDLEVLNYLYSINKPVLGICLGMQLMGKLFNAIEYRVDNHKKKTSYAHEIKLNKYSKIYDILKKDTLKVNSRHLYVLKNCDLLIGAKSNDGYIEEIEDPNKIFFIGVQWHPESMIDYDENQNNLFKHFINVCKKSTMNSN